MITEDLWPPPKVALRRLFPCSIFWCLLCKWVLLLSEGVCVKRLPVIDWICNRIAPRREVKNHNKKTLESRNQLEQAKVLKWGYRQASWSCSSGPRCSGAAWLPSSVASPSSMKTVQKQTFRCLLTTRLLISISLCFLYTTNNKSTLARALVVVYTVHSATFLFVCFEILQSSWKELEYNWIFSLFKIVIAIASSRVGLDLNGRTRETIFYLSLSFSSFPSLQSAHNVFNWNSRIIPSSIQYSSSCWLQFNISTDWISCWDRLGFDPNH